MYLFSKQINKYVECYLVHYSGPDWNISVLSKPQPASFNVYRKSCMVNLPCYFEYPHFTTVLSQLFINGIYMHATVTHTFIFIHCAWKLIKKSHLRDMVQVLFSLVKNLRFLLGYKLYPNGFTSWPLVHRYPTKNLVQGIEAWQLGSECNFWCGLISV